MTLKLVGDTNGVRFNVKVVPGASRDRIVGLLGEALKVAVSKPPQAGAANAAVLKLLAEALDVPAKQVSIVRGHTKPRKEVFVMGVTHDQVRERLMRAVR
jgi:uncharacterized protein (TIGR00251 family)